MFAKRLVQRRATPRPSRLFLIALIALSLLPAFTVAASAAAPSGGRTKPTVVLVHGAWADASGWSDVIKRLQRDGYPVLAPANPLRGLASDAAYLASILDTIDGPIILVGHSYGGAVITNAATGRANVKALVYIAAFIPDEGDDLATLISRHPGSLIVPPGYPGATLIARPYPVSGGDPGIDTYIDSAAFRRIFAADVDAGTAAILAATQRPAEAHILMERSGAAAWKTIPSWALVPKSDNTIGTDNLRAMALHANAKLVETNASHAVLISRPGVVVDLIQTAARTTD
jgi:pimeloyl-ACP methyl ester carboxylesterase